VLDTHAIAYRVRLLRQQKALSQEDLAEKAGVSRATVLNMERGRAVHPSTLRRLAKALGVTPPALTT